MEHQHQQQQQQQHEGNKGGSSILCTRQSSSRWMPTAEQIRVLKDLYYNGGVRSPSAEQIQRISARLRQYGKIEGKNVFYWFQNHKARERQKKRLAVDAAASKFFPHNIINPPPPQGISPGMFGVGHTERSYRDCSVGGVPTVEGNVEWVGAIMPPFSTTSHHQHRPSYFYDGSNYYCNPHPWHHPKEEEDEDEAGDPTATTAEKETLPLFPIHSQAQDDEHDINQHYWVTSNGCYDGQYRSDQQQRNGQQQHGFFFHNNSSDIDASLELTLNSYCDHTRG